jgi:hypothetical protein
MQPERLHGRESGAQSWRGLPFPPAQKVDTLGLQKVEAELRTASHSLWHFRAKEAPSVEVASFLEGAQTALAELRSHLRECREILDGKEPI